MPLFALLGFDIRDLGDFPYILARMFNLFTEVIVYLPIYRIVVHPFYRLLDLHSIAADNIDLTDGLQRRCESCAKAQITDYRQRNRARENDRAAAWRKANRGADARAPARSNGVTTRLVDPSNVNGLTWLEGLMSS